jgi:NAD(P)-dependent dehydrogenase (short-subunit alcohol dehydrogenase family)
MHRTNDLSDCGIQRWSAPPSCHIRFALSDDGVEAHFATNHLGCAALAQALLPALVEGARGAGGAGAHSATSPEQQERSSASGEHSSSSCAAGAGAAAGAAPTQASVAPSELPGHAVCSHPSRIVFVSCSAHQLAYRLMRGYTTPGVWRTAVDGQGAARLFMPVQVSGSVGVWGL